MKNRHKSIYEHCEEDDIILDVDADDSLIGNQVFKLVNSIYQKNSDKWAVYFNFISMQDGIPYMVNSFSGNIPDKIF